MKAYFKFIFIFYLFSCNTNTEFVIDKKLNTFIKDKIENGTSLEIEFSEAIYRIHSDNNNDVASAIIGKWETKKIITKIDYNDSDYSVENDNSSIEYSHLNYLNKGEYESGLINCRADYKLTQNIVLTHKNCLNKKETYVIRIKGDTMERYTIDDPEIQVYYLHIRR